MTGRGPPSRDTIVRCVLHRTAHVAQWVYTERIRCFSRTSAASATGWRPSPRSNGWNHHSERGYSVRHSQPLLSSEHRTASHTALHRRNLAALNGTESHVCCLRKVRMCRISEIMYPVCPIGNDAIVRLRRGAAWSLLAARYEHALAPSAHPKFHIHPPSCTEGGTKLR